MAFVHLIDRRLRRPKAQILMLRVLQTLLSTSHA